MHNQGVCYIHLKEYEKVCALNILIPSIFYLVIIIIMCGYVQAIEAFKTALKMSPQTITYLQLGRAHLKIGSAENAIEVFKKAVK